MSFESALDDLADPAKRLSSRQLTDFSSLDAAETEAFADVWPSLDLERRLTTLQQLSELAEDNVELDYTAIFKLALSDESGEARAAGLRGLYEYEGPDLIGRLLDLLRTDPEPEVRREAAVALGRFAVAAEMGYLRAEDGEAVKSGLIESAEDIDEDERVRARAIEALGAISGEDTENLIESVYQEDSVWLKVGAVDAMGRSCNQGWLPLLVREMGSRAPEMRHAAAFAAGEIGDEQAVAPLKRLAVEDRDRGVQLAAIRALGEIGGPQARVALKSVLYEGEDDLRDAVEEALSEMAFREDPLSPPGL
jgi:HEAT repeat protein